MLKKTKLLFAFALLSSLFVPIIIAFLNLNAVAFNQNFYIEEFKKYDVYSALKGYDIEKINQETIGFLQSKNNYLPMDFFSQREVQHLYDVRLIFQKIEMLYILSIEIAMAFIIACLFFLRGIKKTAFYIALSSLIGSIFTLLLSLVIFLSVRLNFSLSFDVFHNAFFSPGSYEFNPLKEKIVVLYPHALFYDAGAKITANALLTAVAVITLSLMVIVHTTSKRYK